MRAAGLPVREAVMRGAELRVRPVVMTSLTAVLGLLPAALANSIGSQAQKPLAIVVVGGMLVTLFLTQLPDAGPLHLLPRPRRPRRGHLELIEGSHYTDEFLPEPVERRRGRGVTNGGKATIHQDPDPQPRVIRRRATPCSGE